jgi:hypothetical protein
MQRHRYEEIGSGEDFASGAVHPAPECPGDMGTIAML